MLVCGSNVRPKSDETGVLKFFDVYTAETEPELGEGQLSYLCLLPLSAMLRLASGAGFPRPLKTICNAWFLDVSLIRPPLIPPRVGCNKFQRHEM